ncbi:thioesterase domain-containing protein [Methylocucumis oryzae]|uniref:Carrier domain-containing protein n=1 Tax=Methylocucumis oryzae TaxID=1632867 RepID=A0A0F3IJM4_9GAMM|nr:thioesterase domain-containing protein [Methylocucumis oryzae]KJV06718.1 hypothetical protein VZ94_09455 [Methylocucumis oryzae]
MATPGINRATFFFTWPLNQQRLYRTGDKARFIAGSGGELEFLGRVDQQIKLRGFRIEPGEIEAAVMRFPDVVTARVILHTDLNQQAYLLAVVQTEQALEITLLQAFLHSQLPYYMVPTAYQIVDSLPLTTAGKLDIQRLTHTLLVSDIEAKAPSTLNEQRVAKIWSDVLGYAVTTINADFFSVGGHSLLALRLLTALNTAFNNNINLIDLMRQPTIAGQALLLMSELSTDEQGIVELKPGANTPNLFCLPAADGQLMAYQALAAQLPEDYSVVGLQTQFIGETLNDLAAEYVQLIRARQPVGPYHLLGWSLGGLLAYEIAQQLIKTGDIVATLMLLDSYLPATLKALTGKKTASTDRQRLQDFCEDLLHAYDIEIADLIAESHTVDEVLDAVLQRLHELTSVAKNDMLQLWQYFNQLVKAAENYRPELYQGQNMLLVYAEQLGLTPERLIYDWQALSASHLVCHGVIAEHQTLLQTPVVKTLAKIISDHVSSCSSQ